MKKLIVLSAACLFVLGAFANPVNSSQQTGANKTTTQSTMPAKKTPAKTETKPAAKKGAKGTKKVKKAPAK